MDPFVTLAALLALLVPADPVAVLHAWDDRREAAWADGDPAAVRALYLPASQAGEYDAALVRTYRERGLVVRRMETQVLSAAVLQRRAGRIVLRVTDRVAVLEVERDGALVPMPRDRARTRTVELRWVAGEWRVAAVAVDAATSRAPRAPRR